MSAQWAALQEPAQSAPSWLVSMQGRGDWMDAVGEWMQSAPWDNTGMQTQKHTSPVSVLLSALLSPRAQSAQLELLTPSSVQEKHRIESCGGLGFSLEVQLPEFWQ